MSRAVHPASSSTPGRTIRGRRGSGLLVAVLGLGLAAFLTGCGAGQITQTSSQVAAVNGASGMVGAIALRNVELAYPADPQGTYQPGSNAQLIATIVNTGLNQDTLTSISTPAAASVTIDGSTTATKDIPGGFAVQSGTDMDDSFDTASVEPTTESTTPTTGTARTSSSSRSTTTTAPSTTEASQPDHISITLVNLTSVNGQPLRAGLTIPIVFRFAHAGEVTIYVPIAAPADTTNPSVTPSLAS